MNALHKLVYSFQKRRLRRRREQPDDEVISYPSITITSHQSPQSIVAAEQDLESSKSTSSFLYDLARRWAWQAVIFRCQTHPEEASVIFRDRSGDTALHWVCLGPPPLEVIEALLLACPDLAKARNGKGLLPLHVACSYRASGDVVRTLIAVYPEGAGLPTDAGSYPLHLLCDYGCSVDSIQAIVETPSGTDSVTKLDRIYHRTPLFILNERKNFYNFHQSLNDLRQCRQRQRQLLESDSHGASLNNSNLENYQLLHMEPKQVSVSLELRDELAKIEAKIASLSDMEFWNKACLLVHAQYYGGSVITTDFINPTRILHACIGIGIDYFPESLLEFAIFLKSKEMLDADDEGRLPLHLAAAGSEPWIVSDILVSCPQAARVPDSNGKFPLEILTQQQRSNTNSNNGWLKVTEELIFANPLALEALDLDRRLYPLIWSRFAALIRESSNQSKTLSILYESIRGNPSVFSIS